MNLACSIVIPTKDRPAGLLRAVQSALAALPEGGEVIVVDDASQVPATEVLAALASPKLRVASNPGPHGPSGARNHGVALSVQPVIFFLDDDDLLVEGYCRAILSIIPELPPHVGYGFSAALVKTSDGPAELEADRSESGVLPEKTRIDARLAGLGMGFWVRRQVFQALGGLDPMLRVNEDTEFSLRLSAAGVGGYYHAEPGVQIFKDRVRQAGDKASITRSTKAAVRAAGFEYILHKHDDFLKDHGRFRRKCMFRILKYRGRAGKAAGWRAFCRSLRPTLGNRLLWPVFGGVWLRVARLFKA